MKIYAAKVNKANLLNIPSDERILFFAISHFANEIKMLLRFVLWISNSPSNNKAEIDGAIALKFMFLKLLAGKLTEGYNILRKYYFRDVSQKYDSGLKTEGKDALEKIKDYFEKSNVLVKSIRNDFSFHYSPDELDKAFHGISEDFDIYLEENGSANNLYYFAEVIADRALLKSMSFSDDFMAYKKLIEELPKVANWFSSFCDAFLYEFINRYQKDFWDGAAEQVIFENPLAMFEVHIPWFVNADDLYSQSLKDDISS